MMPSRALGKPGRIQMTLFQHRRKNEKKLHIMQIAMQKRQKVECSGHTGIFHRPHYISFRPVSVQKLHYEGGIFLQKLYSALKIFTTEVL
jgi:hypothetical protein